jgi:hypothetical protein
MLLTTIGGGGCRGCKYYYFLLLKIFDGAKETPYSRHYCTHDSMVAFLMSSVKSSIHELHSSVYFNQKICRQEYGLTFSSSIGAHFTPIPPPRGGWSLQDESIPLFSAHFRTTRNFVPTTRSLIMISE